MSTQSQISTAPESEPWLRPLLPAAVSIHARREPGDPATLTAAEALHVARAVPKRVQEFAAGRACAKAALADFGVPCAALLAAPDRQPVWPTGYVGSITHTSGLCVAAVAPHHALAALGIDAEVVGAPTLDIWPTICREEERRWVESLPVAVQPAAVTLLFAAKEAFYKCQYPLVGEWLDFHDLRIDAEWGHSGGSFSVVAMRAIRVADRVLMPLCGRYAFHDRHVVAAISIAPLASPAERPQ